MSSASFSFSRRPSMPMLARNSRVGGVLLFLLLCAGPLCGQTSYYWQNGAIGDWHTPGNWTPSGPPGANNVVYINDGTVRINSGTAYSRSSVLGYTAGTAGTVEVSGSGEWINDAALFVGFEADGTLTIQTGGRVKTTSVVIGPSMNTISSTINLNGSTTSRGVLETAHITRLSGSVRLNWDGGILRATAHSTDFLSGFGATDVEIKSGGGFFDTNGFNVTITPPFTGLGGLTKQGAGVLTLTGANTYTGGTSVADGTLAVNGASASISHSLANMVIGVSSGPSARLEVKNGGTVSNRVGYLGVNAGSIGTAEISVGEWINSDDLYVGFNGAGTLDIHTSGLVKADSVTLGLTSSSSGTLNLNGSNVSRGVLETAWLMAGLGTADFNWNGGILRATSDEGDYLRNFFYGDANILSGGAFFDSNGHNITIITQLTGAGALTKFGAGTLTLTGANTYAGANESAYNGGTNVNAGTLVVDGSFATISHSAANIIIGSVNGQTATLQIKNGASVTNKDAHLGFNNEATGIAEISGGQWINTDTLQVGYRGTGELKISGGQVSSGLSRIGYVAGTNGTADVSGGHWTAASNLIVGDAGTGALTIRTGGRVTANAVFLGNNGSSSGTLNLNGNNYGSGVLETAVIYAGSGTVKKFNWDGGILRATADHTDFLSGFGATDVEIKSGGGYFDSNGHDVTINTMLTGTGPLIKQGVGTLKLTAASTLTGDNFTDGIGYLNASAIVRGGTLLANNTTGSATGTGDVFVQAGATLGGTGFITGFVGILDGGIIAPGASAGTLTLGELILSNTSVLQFELGSPSGIGGVDSDLINIVIALNGSFSTGSLTLNGTLNIDPLAGFGAGVYTLFTYGGSLTDDGLALGNTPAAFALTVDTATAPNSVLLNVTADPAWLVWDGPAVDTTNIEGGMGAWTNTVAVHNWTTDAGTLNLGWPGGNHGARFTVNPGIVTLAPTETISAKGLSFETDGYRITGDASSTLNLTGTGQVDVWADYTATLDVNLTGTQLTKLGTGDLVLIGGIDLDNGILLEAGRLILGEGTGSATVNVGAGITGADHAGASYTGLNVVGVNNSGTGANAPGFFSAGDEGLGLSGGIGSNGLTMSGSSVTATLNLQSVIQGGAGGIGGSAIGGSGTGGSGIGGNGLEGGGVGGAGAGGSATGGAGGGGAGGAGGIGVAMTAPSSVLTLNAESEIYGGIGGAGGVGAGGAGLGGAGTGGTGNNTDTSTDNPYIGSGTGGAGTGGAGASGIGTGGIGGAGGIGVSMEAESSYLTLHADANITGGEGGIGGAGAGGDGIGGDGIGGNALGNDGNVTGGNAFGGAGAGGAGSGGAGGAGGIGVSMSGASSTLVLNGLSNITGGEGRIGGAGTGGRGIGGNGFGGNIATYNGNAYTSNAYGGAGSGGAGSGGAGGAGGIGVSMSGASAILVLNGQSSISGGDGGQGGIGNGGTGTGGGTSGGSATVTGGDIFFGSTLEGNGTGGDGTGGDGGQGGAGVAMTGVSSVLILNDQSAIQGGAGGVRGLGGGGSGTGLSVAGGLGNEGNDGLGGVGVTGSGASVYTAGSISGGLGGDGVTRANAVEFTGGANYLELRKGYSFTGNVVGGTGTDTLALGGSEDFTFSGAQVASAAQFQNFERFVKTGSSVWTLTSGLNIGSTEINQGALIIDPGVTLTTANTRVINTGVLNLNGILAGNAAIESGGSLTGAGQVTGAVSVFGGIISPGNSPGTLTVGGLHLRDDSTLEFELAQPGVKGGGVNDFIQVNGDLTLAGKLALLSIGSEGLYHLIDYTGSFVNSGLTISATPSGMNPGNLLVDTATTGEVNLVYAIQTETGTPIEPAFVADTQYWDGSTSSANGVINGGSGVWALSDTNWTNVQGLINGKWHGQTAVFTNTPGTVSLGSDIPFEKLIFEVGGYQIVSPYGYQLYAPGNAEIQVNTGRATIAARTNVSGTLLKTGGGLLDLRSPVSTSATTITQGTLAVNSTLHSPYVNVHHGATLMGSGLIIGNVFNSGTVAPGNSIGTLTIHGHYTQRSSGVLQIEVGSVGDHDLLVVSGTARLAGTLDIRSLGYKAQFGDQIPFLVAGNIKGGFDEINVPNPARNRGRFVNYGNLGTLLVAPASYTLVAESGNERNLARALDPWIGIEEGDIGAVTLALDLQREDQYAQSFAAISPAYYEGALHTGMELSHSHSQLLHQQLNARRLAYRIANVPAMPAPQSSAKGAKAVTPELQPTSESDLRWSAWTQGSGLFSSGGLSLTPGESFESGTILVGADYLLSDALALGLFASYQEGWGDYDHGGDIDLDATRFGVYATYDQGGFYANTALGFGQTGFDVKRPVQWTYLNRTAASQPDGWEFFTSASAGYDIKRGNWTFGPQASLQYSKLSLDEFSETGAGALNLRLSETDIDSLRTYLGGRIAYTYQVSERFAIIPELRAFWQHEFLDGGSTNARLNGGHGPTFTHLFSDPDEDSFHLGAGVGVQVGANLYLNVYYNLDLGRREEENHTFSVSGTVRF